MSLLSMTGLKKAYESLGEELTRTFDSQSTESVDGGPAGEGSQLARVSDGGPAGEGSQLARVSDAGTQEKEEEEEEGEEEEEEGEDWGEWEEQSKPSSSTAEKTTTPAPRRGMKLSNKSPPVAAKSRSIKGSSTDAGEQRGEETEAEGRQSSKERRELSPSSLPRSAGGRPSPAAPTTSPLATSTPAKSGGKLDSLPREELVKYIKRQAQLLQKTKARCNELSKECDGLKKSVSTAAQQASGTEAVLEELQVVRSERDRAVSEQRTLQQTITGLEQDKQSLGAHVSGLERSVLQLRSQEEDWKCRVEVASTKLTAQQQEHEAVKEQLQAQLASTREELAEARTREEERERDGERMGELRKELEALKGGLESAERERDREREAAARAREEKAGLEEELSRVRTQLREVSVTSEEGRGEVENMRSQLTELQDQFATASEEREKLGAELADCQAGLEAARRERDDGKTELEKTQRENEALQSETDRLREVVEGLEAERNELCAARDSLWQETESLQTERSALWSERDTLRTAKESLQADRDSLQRSLQADRDALLSERDQVLAEKRGLEGEMEVLSGQVRRAEGRAREAEQRLQAASPDTETAVEESPFQSRVEELECEIRTLESRLTSVNTEKETLQGSAEAARSESRTLSAEVERQQRQSQEREAAIVSLKNELEAAGRRLEGIESETAALRAREEEGASERERELQLLREQVSELQGARQEAEDGLAAARKEVERVEREWEATKQTLDQQTGAHRDESKKLKAYIVKMKKDLAEVRVRASAAVPMEEEREGLKRQLEDLRVSVEAEAQRAALSESGRKEAEETIQSMGVELDSLRSERDRLQSSLESLSEELSTLHSELSTAQSDLATFQAQAGSSARAVETAEREASALRDELAREREGHTATRQKLTTALKEAKANSVMNLELADYQRSLQALEEKLSGAQGELEQARGEGREQQAKMDALRKEIDSQTQQCIAVEDRLSKTKALWMKTKKELDGSRKAEGELQAAVVALKAQLEGDKQLAEQSKVEMAGLTVKLQSMQQQSDSSVGVLQKTVRSLEHKLAAAQNELTSSQLALSQCQQDYNSYKVRVHSVLKQKSNGPSPAEISTEIQQKCETEIMQLRAELQDTKSQLSSALVELEEVSEEHQQLTARHEQLLRDSQQTLDSARKKLEEAEARHGATSREQAEVIGQLRQEVVEVTTTFRGQLHSLQEEHQRVAASLREELRLSEGTVTRLQQEADARVLARASTQPDSLPGHTHLSRLVSHDFKAPASAPSEQRSSGEGMDQSELDSNASFPPTPLSREDSQLSFERLLSVADSEVPNHQSSSLLPSSSLDKPRGSSISGGGGVSEAQLRKQLAKAMKTIRGLNELLRDSEEATVRLGEQAKLLKEEIRRLERNQEREEDVSNLEYLKNVVLKFLHSQDEAEQTALVPVITQLLKLSPQEIKFLQDAAKGTPSALPDANSGLPSPSDLKGLSGYIHRWTGY